MATVGKPIKVYSNPHRAGKRSSKMAKAKKGEKNPMPSGLKAYWAKHRKGGKPKRKNTSLAIVPLGHHAPAGYATNPKKKKKRNPEGLRQLIGSPKSLLIQGVAGLTSAVATRQLPQMVMGPSNTGWKGYGANVLVGAAATWAAASFVGPDAGKAALVGALVIIFDRVLTEKVSPVGKYLSLAGVGDATAATRLGTIAEGYYIHPTVYDASGRPIVPHEITDAALFAYNAQAPKQQQQPPALGYAGYQPRVRSRFGVAA